MKGGHLCKLLGFIGFKRWFVSIILNEHISLVRHGSGIWHWDWLGIRLAWDPVWLAAYLIFFFVAYGRVLLTRVIAEWVYQRLSTSRGGE
jgi:hypothetical protein